MRSAIRLAIPALGCALIASRAVSPATAESKSYLLANVIVKSVSASSLTVSANGKDCTFVVDAKTRVIKKGPNKAIPLPPADGGSLARLLKQGDHVTITYQEMGAMKYASRIEVTFAAVSPGPRSGDSTRTANGAFLPF